MSVDVLNRFSLAFDLAKRNQGQLYIAQSGQAVTKDKALEGSPDQIIDLLMQELKAFTHLPSINKDPNLKQLKLRVRTYFKGKLKKSSPKMCLLFSSLFPLAKARWKLAKSMLKPVEIDKNSETGFKILNKSYNAARFEDLDTINAPRDTLFLIQQLRDFLLKLCHVQIELCDRLCAAEVEVLPIETSDEPEDDEPYAAPLYYNYPDCSLLDEVKKVCRRLVDQRCTKEERVTKVVEPLIKQILTHTDRDRILKTLELNELIAQREDLLDDWQKHQFSAGCYVYNAHLREQFVAINYKPRRQLSYLSRLGASLTDYLQRTLETSGPVLATVENQLSVTQHCLEMLNHYTPLYGPDHYTKLTVAMDALIQRFLSDWPERAQDYKMVITETTDLKPSHPEFEQYKWTEISHKTYRSRDEALKTFTSLPESVVSKIVKRVSAPKKPVSSDRGYDIELPKRDKCCFPKAKPKKPAPKPRAASTTTYTCEIETITVALSKVALTLPTPPKVPQQALPQTAEPNVTAKAKLVYDNNVSRWNLNRLKDENPILNDPKYRGKPYTTQEMRWIQIKHNFAQVVDDFIEHGAAYENPFTRRQLVADITRTTKNRKERKTGVITYSKGSDSLWHHRYFTNKNKTSEIIDKEYAEKGWEMLKALPKEPKDGINPNLVAKDGSFVVYQTDQLVIIDDPKNSCRIRLVLKAL